jgi:hypothetical protein
MRILLLTRTMLILYGATVACGGDGGTGPGAGIEGTYPLRVVNNTAVPTAKDYSWGIETFDGGWLKLEADGTWSLEIHGGTSFDGASPRPGP